MTTESSQPASPTNHPQKPSGGGEPVAGKKKAPVGKQSAASAKAAPKSPPPLPEPCPKKWGSGLVLSTILHLILLLVLSQIYFTHPPSLTATQIDSRWEDTESLEIDTVTDIDIAAAESSSSSESAESVSETVAETVLPDTSLVDIESQLDQGWESQLENLDVTGSVGEGMATGTGVEGMGTGGMFANRESDKNIVYVVDSSASMNFPYPGPTKTRFGRVKFELLKAVHSMSSEQRFFIVFFNQNAWPMPYKNMIKVKSKAAEKALKWMATKEAFGETDPTDALQIALRLKPDTIHFLTDGELDEVLVKIVKELNYKNVRINTYCIANREGERVVLKIAKQNGGTYKFIP